MHPVIVVGGYGTFGARVTRELAARGLTLTVAGRDLRRAQALAHELGPAHRAVAADVRTSSCTGVLAGHRVVVNCAGPFTHQGPALPEACLEEGCHYIDLGDDRAHARLVRGLSGKFRERGLAAVFGCSTLPAISGALALRAGDGIASPPRHARVTLLLGNNNPKGVAAIQNFVEQLGKTIEAPQGVLKAFRDGETVLIPEPFGRRTVFNFESPEYDLFPELLGVSSVVVKVGFELRIATRGFVLLGMLPFRYGRRLASWLEWLGRVLPRLGSSGAAVITELFYADGAVRRAALSARRDGQRMGAMPCVLVAEALCREESGLRGAATAYEYLGAGALLDRLAAEGYQLECGPA